MKLSSPINFWPLGFVSALHSGSCLLTYFYLAAVQCTMVITVTEARGDSEVGERKTRAVEAMTVLDRQCPIKETFPEESLIDSPQVPVVRFTLGSGSPAHRLVNVAFNVSLARLLPSRGKSCIRMSTTVLLLVNRLLRNRIKCSISLA